MPNKIQTLFSEVPDTYERINHILTLGLDILWRKKAAKMAGNHEGSRWLDVCTGTGETAIYLTQKTGSNTTVYAIDFSIHMLKKAQSKPEADRIHFSISDIKSLPFPDGTFDLITISFATRNINTNRQDLMQSFQELNRILKPDGEFIHLETSQPRSVFIKILFHGYIKLFVKIIGSKISGSKPAYAYLARTIPRFYSMEELTKIFITTGFKPVKINSLLFGVAAIHHLIKVNNSS